MEQGWGQEDTEPLHFIITMSFDFQSDTPIT